MKDLKKFPCCKKLESMKKKNSKAEDISSHWEDLGAEEPKSMKSMIKDHHYRKGSVPNTPLPWGWGWQVDPSTSKVYFLNHIRKATCWDDPRPLPHKWEAKFDVKRSKTYYLDHNTKISTWYYIISFILTYIFLMYQARLTHS